MFTENELRELKAFLNDIESHLDTGDCHRCEECQECSSPVVDIPPVIQVIIDKLEGRYPRKPFTPGERLKAILENSKPVKKLV